MFERNFLLKLQLLILVFYPFFWLGIGNKYPWILLGPHGVEIGNFCFFAITCIFFVLAWCPIDKWLATYRDTIFPVVAMLASIFILIYDAIQYTHFANFGYQLPVVIYAIDGINCILIAVLIRKINFLFYWCCIFFMLHLSFSIHYFPITELRSNMLTGISATVNSFLNHQYPYLLNTKDMIPYLPITWAAFIPGNLFAVDLRIIGAIYYLLILILIGINLKKQSNISKYLICLWLINPYFLMRHELYFQLYLLEITVIALYLAKFRRILQLILLGCFIVTLQFAWLLYPFLILSISKNIKQLIINLISSISCAIIFLWIILGHFLLTYIKYSFISDGIHAFQSAKDLPYSTDITFGLAPIFSFASNQHLLFKFQLLSYALIGLISLIKWYKKQSVNYLAVGLYTYLLFIASNYFLETYFYVPILLFGGLITLHQSTDTPD